jgi:rhamnosyltransferase
MTSFPQECCILNTYCIIVCYRPDLVQVMGLCDRLLADDAKVILVDNTEAPCLDGGSLPEGCSLITLNYNSGIAFAQNVGVAAALSKGATILAFFDQDSNVEPGLLDRLLAAITPGTAEVVAPLCVDHATGTPLPSLLLSRHGFSKPIHRPDSPGRYRVDVVISSGTVATREAFDLAGAFEQGWFIDFTDAEWCLRCRCKHVPIYVVPGAVMGHSIGTRSFRFGPLTILVHGPTRCYYQIRNSFLLLRKRHVPFIFALKQIVSVILNRIILLFGVEDRRAYVKAYLSAVRDGIKGVAGARSG